MRAALYARVSTRDKEQDPETQLVQLRCYCEAHGVEVAMVYTDHASAANLRDRTAWRVGATRTAICFP